ncbi:MAG TPA: alpha/beta hydrolase, partial [Bacteroidetes bacterium]|nr:alpha/beta hydrolase [Bacteroidota bacterium]
MKHTAYYLNWKGHNLHVQEWMPADHPKAHIALIHGQSDHSGRYAHVATFFTERQMAVSAIDLVGHGKSQGK